MKIKEILRIPYMLEAESISSDDQWTCLVSFPELPDCQVEHNDVEEGIRLLYCKRLLTLLDLLVLGQMPPLPRQPIRFDPNIGPVETLGLSGLIEAIAELEPAEVPAAFTNHPRLASDLDRARAQLQSLS